MARGFVSSSMALGFFALALVAGFGCTTSAESASAVPTAAVPRPPAPTEVASARPLGAMPATAPALLPELAAVAERKDLRKLSAWEGDARLAGVERVRHAERAKSATVKTLFADAGVTFPPTEVLFRVFKHERELEVWANGAKGAPMRRIATYEVCAMSGGPGPKRREGDRQVPEGFYRIKYFWPDSAFWLSANVGYPNPSDRARGGPAPGSDIMIHGGCASIGCVAMTDERIEELWVIGGAVQYAGEPVHVHIFPGRDLAAFRADPAHAAHHAFWAEIAPGLEAFDASARLPRVTIDPKGAYVIHPE